MYDEEVQRVVPFALALTQHRLAAGRKDDTGPESPWTPSAATTRELTYGSSATSQRSLAHLENPLIEGHSRSNRWSRRLLMEHSKEQLATVALGYYCASRCNLVAAAITNSTTHSCKPWHRLCWTGSVLHDASILHLGQRHQLVVVRCTTERSREPHHLLAKLAPGTECSASLSAMA